MMKLWSVLIFENVGLNLSLEVQICQKLIGPGRFSNAREIVGLEP